MTAFQHELVLESPWTTGVGEQIQLTARFSEGAVFYPAQFLIQDAGDWCVHDIRFQHTSQLSEPSVAADRLLDALRRRDPVRFDEEILLIVSRQKPGEAPFRCTIQGRALK